MKNNKEKPRLFLLKKKIALANINERIKNQPVYRFKEATTQPKQKTPTDNMKNLR